MLTDRSVATLKAKKDRYEVFDTVVPALGVRVGTSGTKSWVLFFRPRVKSEAGDWVTTRQLTRWTFGHYPAMTCAAARKRARAALVGLDTGLDPAAEKHAVRVGETFADLCDHYMKHYAKVKKRSWDQDQKAIDTELLPHWRHKKAKQITRRDVRDVLERIVERGSPIRANRVWSLISKIFNHGLAHDIIEANPAARIAKQTEVSRDRELTTEETRELWTALDTCQLPLPRTDEDRPAPTITAMIALGLQVQLVTGQRPGEVFTMERAELDLDAALWEMPGKKTKNGEAHVVPLSALAVELVKKAIKAGPAESRWVFAGQPYGNVADRAKKAASQLTAAGAVSFAFRRHDLRRTCASGMARLGVDGNIISRILNHVDGGARATRVYDRYDRAAEKRAALDRWAVSVTLILQQGDKEP